MGEEEGKSNNSLEPMEKKRGGFTASIFIFVLLALDNMGFVANMVSMVLYFLGPMHFNLATAANTLTNFMGTNFLLSLLGGFISDTYLSRYTTCLIFGSIQIVGLSMMTIQAYSKALQPKFCGLDKPSCMEGGIGFYFYVSLYLWALGSGGVKGALPALGGDQFGHKDEAKKLATFFNLFLLSSTLGATIGVTVVVWVSTTKAWYWGFFISTMGSLIGFIVLALGRPFYRLQVPRESPLIRVFQVIVLAIKNRSLSLPGSSAELHEISEKESAFTNEKISHTEQFSFLDKAAILGKDTKAEPWKVCTVTQVEEVKVLTRMLPILLSTIIMNTCLAQLQTFSVQQGNRSMNRKLGNFEVPAPSIPVIPLIFMCVLIPLYEYFFVPFARKITGHPAGITQLQRVGIGLVLSAVSMAVAGIVEVKRRNYALAHSPLAPGGISLFWLSFQYAIFGIADMFTLVGLLEFFYREAPAGMKSLSTSFTWLSLSFGYFLSSIFVSIINAVTAKIAPSKLGWLHGIDINQNNVNLFYFFLAILSCLNFANYLYWASWYKYKPEEPETKVQLKEVDKPLVIEHENGSNKVTAKEVSSVQTEENKEKVASL
ncbi:hypothetical protein ACLB2K_057100 [Fragaria x ananassa]